MLEQKETWIEFDLNQIIEAFVLLSGWEYSNGLWNAKFDKPVTFEIEYSEGDTFQHEQNYVIFDHGQFEYYYRECCFGEDISLEFILNRCEKQEYTGKNYIMIPFGWIVEYLRRAGELPSSETSILITN